MVQIGWYNVPEDTTMVNRGFACAAWWQEIAIKAGKYPVMAERYFFSERDNCYTSQIDNTSVFVKLPGTIVADDFQSYFCGIPIGENYDTTQNAGNPDSIILRPYAHAIAWDIIDGISKIELLPEFEARIIEYEFDGRKGKTAGLFKKDEVTSSL